MTVVNITLTKIKTTKKIRLRLGQELSINNNISNANRRQS